MGTILTKQLNGMTKAQENSTDRLLDDFPHYPLAQKSCIGIKSTDQMVLDLSFKKSEDDDNQASVEEKSLLSKPSINQEIHHQHQQIQQETNNNNVKYLVQNNRDYNENRSPNRNFNYSSSSSSSEHHDVKSPVSDRSYVLTPPSESSSLVSPKNIKDETDEIEGSLINVSSALDNKFQTKFNVDTQFYPNQLIGATNNLYHNENNTSLSNINGKVGFQSNIPGSGFSTETSYYPVYPGNYNATQFNDLKSSSQQALAYHHHHHQQQQQHLIEDTVKKSTPRPFKAYPKDSLSLSLTSDLMFDPEVKQNYQKFRNQMLDTVKKTNEGTNIKMRRNNKSPNPMIVPTSSSNSVCVSNSSFSEDRDAAYWERRRKNNEAAKRSRDARRAKEDEIAIKAAFFEQEYLRLKCENKLLKEEMARLKFLTYGH